MIRRLLVLCLAVLALGGCASMSHSVFPQRYALAVPASVSSPAGATPAHALTLRITRIDTPAWLGGTAMYYRLTYRQDGRISAYSRSQWIAPPATQLAHLLEQVLRPGRGWAAVLGPNASGHADMTVHLKLDDFSQHFASPETSHGVVDATATLVRNGNGHVVAQEHFHISVAAPSADAPGGVKALDRASMELAMRLRRWLLEHAHADNANDS